MKKSVVSIVCAALMVLTFTGCTKKETKAAADYKLVLKMSHVFAPNEQLTKSLSMVVDNIYKRTNGAIEIQQYPQGQLATYKDGVEQVVQGAKFISVEDPSYLGDYVADFNALVGPMLYNNFDQYEYMIETDLVKGMIKEVEEKHGIKVLALDYIFGFRSLMTNKVITEPQDLKGMKIRVPGSQLFIDTLTAMGANATPLPFSETISAVQQGVVDGLEGTMDAYGTNGSAEVAKKMALTNHFLGTCGVYINRDLFNSIPKEYRDIVQEEFTKGAKQMIAEISKNYAISKSNLEAKGITFNEVNHEAFAKSVEPVYKNMKNVSPGILEKLRGELKKMPK